VSPLSLSLSLSECLPLSPSVSPLSLSHTPPLSPRSRTSRGPPTVRSDVLGSPLKQRLTAAKELHSGGGGHTAGWEHEGRERKVRTREYGLPACWAYLDGRSGISLRAHSATASERERLRRSGEWRRRCCCCCRRCRCRWLVAVPGFVGFESGHDGGSVTHPDGQSHLPSALTVAPRIHPLAPRNPARSWWVEPQSVMPFRASRHHCHDRNGLPGSAASRPSPCSLCQSVSVPATRSVPGCQSTSCRILYHAPSCSH